MKFEFFLNRNDFYYVFNVYVKGRFYGICLDQFQGFGSVFEFIIFSVVFSLFVKLNIFFFD